MGIEKTLAKAGVVLAGLFGLNYGVNYFLKIDLFTQALNMVSGLIPGAGAFVLIAVVGLIAYGGFVVVSKEA